MNLHEIYETVIYQNPNRMTDKGAGIKGIPDGHTYTLAYDLLISKYRYAPINFLEIGINNGGSLLMWSMFFEKANIYGIDNRACFDPFHPSQRIQAYVFDAGNESVVDDVFKNIQFDIIIDDGAHEKESQIRMFNVFGKRVKDDGIYIIEDIQNLDNDLEYFLHNIPKTPMIIDCRKKNNRYDDVLLVYNF